MWHLTTLGQVEEPRNREQMLCLWLLSTAACLSHHYSTGKGTMNQSVYMTYMYYCIARNFRGTHISWNGL